MNENTIGIIAGILTSVAMMPQLIKVIKKKDAENLSSLTLFILVSGLGFWVYYGFQKNDFPIIITNGFSFILNVILLIFSFIYKK